MKAMRNRMKKIWITQETEDVLQDQFKALQDKGIACILERLPAEFTEPVLDTVLQLFPVHSMGAANLSVRPNLWPRP
ncbi:hypothetical protein PHLCEN_2v11656, partial [Hermanssonia centrifuga]